MHDFTNKVGSRGVEAETIEEGGRNPHASAPSIETPLALPRTGIAPHTLMYRAAMKLALPSNSMQSDGNIATEETRSKGTLEKGKKQHRTPRLTVYELELKKCNSKAQLIGKVSYIPNLSDYVHQAEAITMTTGREWRGLDSKSQSNLVRDW